MRRRACLSLGMVGVTTTSLGWAAEQQFRFKLPPAFKPPGEVTPVEGVLEEAILEEARAHDAYGVVMQGGVAVATFAALEKAGAPPLLSSLASVTKMIELTPQLKGAKAVSCTTPTIAGAQCSRIELELSTPDSSWRKLAYYVPGGKRWASLQIHTWPEHYDPLAKELDALVAVLPGIEAPHSSIEPPKSDQQRIAEIGLVAGGAAAFGAFMRAWLKRSRAAEAAAKTKAKAAKATAAK